MGSMSTSRLPQLPHSTDRGYVYVVQEDSAFKIGFTRDSLDRRVHDSGGNLVALIPTGQRPAQLEYLIANRFAAKRLHGYKDNDGGKREWYALTDDDIAWLQHLASHLNHTL